MSDTVQAPGPATRPHPEGRRDEHGIRIELGNRPRERARRAVISVLVDHEPGVLATVSGLFARRRFNIEELTVGAIDEERARITLVAREPGPGLRQVRRQLGKLQGVRSVAELRPDAVRREIVLVKIDGRRPADAGALADMYGARVVDASEGTITVELTGSRQKVNAAIEAFGRFGVREIARAGTVALERGKESTG